MLSFPPLLRRTLRWRPEAGEGLEHLDVEATAAGVSARSVAVGAREGRRFGLSYALDCDAGWRLRRLAIEATDGRRLALASDGRGEWRDGEGRPLPALRGCIDVDLSGSPFTNTLPIRRMALEGLAGPCDLRMAYLPFDTLEPFADGQRYTALEPGRLYRYEAADGGFEAELPVDGDGLVLDYPGLFRRLD